jgi:serine/threonine protein kinase
MIGKTVSHYKILERIGGGGMGVVYKAEDTKLKRLVALKFLPPAFATDPTTQERFIHEAQAASALQHNNICAIHEIDETDDGQMYIVMDYYEGKTLGQLSMNNEQLSIDKIIDYIIQIAQGLQKAHEKGIIHRDIKPANIMITDDGEVKILDFGLAKLPKGTILTKEKSTLGTTNFMSPEMIEGKEVDHRTDIWSLGVLFYELISGQLPFSGEYESAVMYAIVNESYKPITQEKGEGFNELDKVINKCLEKNPNNRFQHLDDLIVDLQGLKRYTESSKKDILSKSSKILHKPAFWIFILFSATIIIMTGYYFSTFGPSSDSTLAEMKWENSIAVLLFDDLSPKGDQEFFCAGITEQILNNLSKIKQLKVIARTSVMKFKNTERNISQIAKELNVIHVLEGSASKIGDRVRIHAQLIKSADEAHIWSEYYDYNYAIDSIFAIYDDISRKIANALIVNISTTSLMSIKSVKPDNLEAWENYLMGKYFHYQKYFGATYSHDDFYKSESLFKKAIEKDPNYAPSYAGLADLYNSFYNAEQLSAEENQLYLELQVKYITEAYKINPRSAEVLYVKGYVHKAKREYRESYDSFKKSVMIEPNNWQTNFGLGLFLNSKGLHYLAIKFYSRALEINPIYPQAYAERALAYIAIGDVDLAESDLLKALEIDPKHRASLAYGIRHYLLVSNYRAADDLLKKREKFYPNSKITLFFRTALNAINGKTDIEDLKQFSKSHQFQIDMFLERKENSLEFLTNNFNRVKRLEDSWYLFMKNMPVYDFLRTDPRFQDILAKHKEIYEENLEKYPDINL